MHQPRAFSRAQVALFSRGPHLARPWGLLFVVVDVVVVFSSSLFHPFLKIILVRACSVGFIFARSRNPRPAFLRPSRSISRRMMINNEGGVNRFLRCCCCCFCSLLHFLLFHRSGEGALLPTRLPPSPSPLRISTQPPPPQFNPICSRPLLLSSFSRSSPPRSLFARFRSLFPSTPSATPHLTLLLVIIIIIDDVPPPPILFLSRFSHRVFFLFSLFIHVGRASS